MPYPTLQQRAEEVLTFLAVIGANKPAALVRELMGLIPEEAESEPEELWGHPTTPTQRPGALAWCGQCDRRVDRREIGVCKSQFCSAKAMAA